MRPFGLGPVAVHRGYGLRQAVAGSFPYASTLYNARYGARYDQKVPPLQPSTFFLSSVQLSMAPLATLRDYALSAIGLARRETEKKLLTGYKLSPALTTIGLGE